jgi:hypothetical protein
MGSLANVGSSSKYDVISGEGARLCVFARLERRRVSTEYLFGGALRFLFKVEAGRGGEESQSVSEDSEDDDGGFPFGEMGPGEHRPSEERKTGWDVGKAGWDIGKAGWDIGKAGWDIGKTGSDIGKTCWDIGKIGWELES